LVKPRPVLINTWIKRREGSLKLKKRVPDLKIKRANTTSGWVSHDLMFKKAKASVLRD
jgi:hypothetical protein